MPARDELRDAAALDCAERAVELAADPAAASAARCALTAAGTVIDSMLSNDASLLPPSGEAGDSPDRAELVRESAAAAAGHTLVAH